MIRYLAIILLLPLFLLAGESKMAVRGYLKSLFFTEKYPRESDWLADNLLHGRLDLQYYAGQNLTGVIALRFRQYAGESVRKDYITNNQISTQQDLLNLDWLVYERASIIGYSEIDRLWLDWTATKFQISIGRQRIAWGTNLVWNPTDLFNPASVLDFDYEEQPAVDAVRLQYYTGPLAKLEFALKPDRDADQTVAAGLYRFNIRNYDFNLLAGIRNFRWMAGISWAGDINKAGFRGEMTVSRNRRATKSSDFALKWFGIYPIDFYEKPELTAALSIDYTFRNSFYAHTELLCNSNGINRNAGLLLLQARELGLPTLARWSIFQEFAYDLTPLTRLSWFGIFNPNDKSIVILPSITYSLATNLDLLLLGLISDGEPLTEFGAYYDAVVLCIKWSF